MAEMTDEYIELCRKLALPLPDGRLCEWIWADGDNNGVFTLRLDEYEDTIGGPDEPGDGVWLPREGDWLEKFRDERIPLTLRLMYDEHGEPFWLGVAPHPMGLNEQQQGDDPALVLCRLYMAVKGIA
jgi:hypothetical protein